MKRHCRIPFAKHPLQLQDARVYGRTISAVHGMSTPPSHPCPPHLASHLTLRSWDTYLIRTLQRCPAFKPVLTTYPVGYQLPHKIPAGETRPTLLVPDGFGPEGMLRQTGRLLLRTARDPLPSPLWASGFSFSGSALLLEVCHGSVYVFGGGLNFPSGGGLGYVLSEGGARKACFGVSGGF